MKNTASQHLWAAKLTVSFFLLKISRCFETIESKKIAVFAFVISRKTVRNSVRGHFVTGFSEQDDYQRVFLDLPLCRAEVSTCIP